MKTLSVSLVCVGPKNAKNKTYQLEFCYDPLFLNYPSIVALTLTFLMSIYLQVCMNFTYL